MEEENTPQENKNKMNPAIPLALVGCIVILVVGIILNKPKEATKPEVKVTKEANTAKDKSVKGISTSALHYKDGQYSAEGDYTSPGGTESINVTVTLKNDSITDSNVKSNAFRRNSIKFQGIFIDNYKQYVTGKNIDEIKLDKVSGSSLTPGGFNDALDKIKTEAKA